MVFISVLQLYVQTTTCALYDATLSNFKLIRDSFVLAISFVAFCAEVEKKEADISYLLISLVVFFAVYALCRALKKELVLKRLSNFNSIRQNEAQTVLYLNCLVQQSL